MRSEAAAGLLTTSVSKETVMHTILRVNQSGRDSNTDRLVASQPARPDFYNRNTCIQREVQLNVQQTSMVNKYVWMDGLDGTSVLDV